jgi:hypothetical protein
MDVTFIKISNFGFRPRLLPTYFWGWFKILFSSNVDYLFNLMFPMNENMNKGTIWIVTLVIIIDYIQM